MSATPSSNPPPRSPVSTAVVGQFSWGLVIIFVLATACWVLLPYTGHMFSALVFLMAIVLAGLRWNRGPVLAMATLSALVWNFVFIPPQFTLHIEKPQDLIMFVLFFVVAMSMGHLTTRVHEREEARERQQREKEALMLEREQLLEAKHQAEMLAASERLYRTFLDSVSHEMKTPIAIIRTALGGLGEGNPFAREIESATLRMQRIVENFLEMTRVESPTLTALRDWSDLNDIIHSATEPIREPLVNHPLSLDGVHDMPLLKLDSRLLTQSLSNVLHNATLYTPEGSPIELRAKLINQSLVLTVRDHGKGLQPGDEERIFAKFYRAPGSPPGGTGLGLAIARGLLRAQGGDITARNHADGGAVFELRVPVETHPV